MFETVMVPGAVSVTDPVHPAPEMVAVAPAVSFSEAGSVSVNPMRFWRGLPETFKIVKRS
jgi:hypothetical protein